MFAVYTSLGAKGLMLIMKNVENSKDRLEKSHI